jgi:hypothetical protein
MKPTRVFLGVALVSLCVLMLQLALTRLFSATMYYHFAFLAISLALLGSGASGVFVYLMGPRLSAARAPRAPALAAALFAAATAAALVVILANPLSPLDSGRTTLVRLSWIYGASALPFFFAGCVVTLAITRFAPQMSRLYLFDLGGAAAGCLLLIPVMDHLGAVNTVLVVAAVAAVGALVLHGSPGRGGMAALAALALALAAFAAYNAATGRLDVRRAKGLVEEGHVIFSRWNSFSRVTVWGSLDNDAVLIMIDADAATLLSRDGSDLRRHAAQAERVEALAYRLRPVARALIIGPGGGNDVIMARLFSAREVIGVEVNPIIVRDIMLSEPFFNYSGGLYAQPGVRIFVDEGRSFIRGSRQRYDVIQGTMVDTWAATAAGAFALTENNLYTVEAFTDYLTRLSERGVLSMTRWYLEPPDQLLRLFSLARAAMAQLGIPRPERHLMLVRGPVEPGSTRAPATFLLGRAEFTDEEARAVEEVAARNGYEILYTSLRRPPNEFTRLAEAEDPERVWSSAEGNIAPPTDNSPFFFNTVRLRNLGAALGEAGEWRKTNLGTFVLLSLLAITAVLTLAFILGPLAVARGRVLAAGRGAWLAGLLYFASLGAGFIVLEVALVQKCILFLGHPVYSLAVVLFSLLGFSGIGSLLSGRFPESRLRSVLPAVLVALVALVVLYVLGLSPLFHALVQLSRPYRIAISVALLAPLGLVMGMPMPIGVRMLARESPDLVPWAWGVNGAASVMGSAAALAIALVAGFNQAMLVAAALYLAAIVCRRPRWGAGGAAQV